MWLAGWTPGGLVQWLYRTPFLLGLMDPPAGQPYLALNASVIATVATEHFKLYSSAATVAFRVVLKALPPAEIAVL
jgi:hypothetical protein